MNSIIWRTTNSFWPRISAGTRLGAAALRPVADVAGLDHGLARRPVLRHGGAGGEKRRGERERARPHRRTAAAAIAGHSSISTRATRTVPALLRPEDRGLAFAHLEPVLAEGLHDVGLVRDHDHRGARRGRRLDQLLQCRGPPRILVRRDHHAGLGEVGRLLGVGEARQQGGLEGAVEAAGVGLADRHADRLERRAERLGGVAALVVQLPLRAGPLGLQGREIGLVGMRGAVAHDDDMSAALQFGRQRRELGLGRLRRGGCRRKRAAAR